MRSIFFLAAALLSPVNGAAWRLPSRHATEDAGGQDLRVRQASTCPTPTTTVTTTTTRTRYSTTCAQPTTTVVVNRYSTVLTTRTIKSTSTVTATSTKVTTATQTTTRTIKTTLTDTTTRTIRTTSTITKNTTNTFSTTRTRTTTVTQTATTCPAPSSSSTSLSSSASSSVASSTTSSTTSSSTASSSTTSSSTTSSSTTSSSMTSASTTSTTVGSSTSTSSATSSADTTSTSSTSSASTTSSTSVSTSDTTSITTVTTSSSTTSSSATTSSTSRPLPVCSPVQDGSFEQATPDQLDQTSETPLVAGGWTTLGGFASVTSNGPTYANDGSQNGVIGESTAGTSSIYQDLTNLNGVYSLSYYYAVFLVYNGLCTFQVKLGDTVVDTFQATAAMAADLNQETIPYTQRTIAQTPLLSGTVRLSFNYVCPDSNTYSISFVDTVQMAVQNANPGVNCVASANQNTNSGSSSTTVSTTTTPVTTQPTTSTTQAPTAATTQATTVTMSTTTTTTTTTSSTTTSVASSSSASPLLCNPILDGSFEQATQDQLDGGLNRGDGQPAVAGAWTSLNTGAVVSANGPTWAHDGALSLLFFAGSPTNSVMYQDLINMRDQYSFTYWYGVWLIAGGNPCTLQAKLGDTVIDSVQITADLGPDADGNPVWRQRTVGSINAPSSGNGRLSFNYICTDPDTFSGTLVDSVSMQSQDQCVSS